MSDDELNQKEKTIFNYIVTQHDRLFRHIDALDLKIAQVAAINALVLSVIITQLRNANSEFLFTMGLTLIIMSLFIAVYAIAVRPFDDSPSPESYGEGGSFEEFKNLLISDMETNRLLQNNKAKCFNIMLVVYIIGLMLVIGGFYV